MPENDSKCEGYNMYELPKTSETKAASYDYFPTTWQAVIWRNWGYVPVERIARVLQATCEEICAAALALGLPADPQVDEIWEKRGFITLIRVNWHLCTYEQILILLNITAEQLAFTLQEDDFLWHKLGDFKPAVVAPRYAPLTPEQKAQTAQIKAMFETRFPAGHNATDNAFAFIKDYYKPLTPAEMETVVLPDGENLRMVYPYFALYGDALIDESLDPLPERLLAQYAKEGINGIWMQGLLYQLVEFPFDPGYSQGREKRIAALNRLVAKAKKFGIGIYLYLNEPRAMPESFFEAYPHLRGHQKGEFCSMCTSTPEVQDYLYHGMKELFTQVPNLAGFFCITMSENLTNCYSHAISTPTTCPRCAERTPWEVVAEVSNAMTKGAHEASAKAKAITWTWYWQDDWAEKAIPLLNQGQILQCTSEEAMELNIGGVKTKVLDYTMSHPGPGERSKRLWRLARELGHAVSAKVQVNNSWELAAVPYIPVFDKIAEHINNVKKEGVTHLHAAWTLGGCPTPNLSLAAWLMEGKGDVRDFMRTLYGKSGDGLYEAQKFLSEGFGQFPFYIGFAYDGPQHYGPMAPFFLKNTGYTATMVGFPYDDLDRWRRTYIYPVDVLQGQMQKVCNGFREGLEKMLPYQGVSETVDELILMTKAVLCQYESTLHHITFVKHRGEDATLASAEDRKILLSTVHAEMAVVQELIGLRLADSRIGYESSNHYFYSLQDLKEKMINLAACENALS